MILPKKQYMLKLMLSSDYSSECNWAMWFSISKQYYISREHKYYFFYNFCNFIDNTSFVQTPHQWLTRMTYAFNETSINNSKIAGGLRRSWKKLLLQYRIVVFSMYVSIRLTKKFSINTLTTPREHSYIMKWTPSWKLTFALTRCFPTSVSHYIAFKKNCFNMPWNLLRKLKFHRFSR